MFKSLAKSHHFPEIITTCDLHAAWFYFQPFKQKKSPPKKTKDKNYRNRKKSESLFLELSLEGHCLDRPLWRHCGGGCLIGDCCSRLWGSDRGAATRATEEPPTSERGATGPSPRTLGPIAHSAAHHFHPHWVTLSIIFYRRCLSCIKWGTMIWGEGSKTAGSKVTSVCFN